MKTSKTSSDGDNKMWICSYKFVRRKQYDEKLVMRGDHLIISKEMPTYAQVKAQVLSDNIPMCYDIDEDFELISVKEKKISRFRLPLEIDPLMREETKFHVVAIDKSGEKRTLKICEYDDDAIHEADFYNKYAQESLSCQTHAFVVEVTHVVRQEQIIC